MTRAWRMLLLLPSMMALPWWFASVAHGQVIAFDPPTLPPLWWQSPEIGSDDRTWESPSSSIAALCASSTTSLRMEGIFGHLNNVLIEYAHLLFNAVTQSPPATVHLPRAFHRFVGAETFDVSAATSSWACVHGLGGVPTAQAARQTAVIRNASDIYHAREVVAVDSGNSSAAAAVRVFERVAIAQLILRPAAPLRSHVEAFERKLLGRRGGGFNNRPIFPADICGMSDDYIDAALRRRRDLGVHQWPIVLAHDGQNFERAAAIQAKYKTVSYEGPLAHFVDLLLTIRSGYFIGNPASSFSHNAARVRHLMRYSDPASTISCDGPRGADPAYC